MPSAARKSGAEKLGRLGAVAPNPARTRTPRGTASCADISRGTATAAGVRAGNKSPTCDRIPARGRPDRLSTAAARHDPAPAPLCALAGVRLPARPTTWCRRRWSARSRTGTSSTSGATSWSGPSASRTTRTWTSAGAIAARCSPTPTTCTRPTSRTAPAADIGLRLDLVAALAQLSVEQREPLLLVTLEQLSYAECAEVLHIPIGTVMSRISRGRAAMRELLDGRSPQAPRGAAPRRLSFTEKLSWPPPPTPKPCTPGSTTSCRRSSAPRSRRGCATTRRTRPACGCGPPTRRRCARSSSRCWPSRCRSASPSWSGATPRSPSAAPGWRRWAAAVLVFVLGGGVGAALTWRLQPQPVRGRAVLAPTGAGWIQRAAMAHAVYTPEVRHPVEVKAQEEHLSRWLTRRLNTR